MQAEQAAKDQGVQDQVKFVAANAFELPFENGTFDVVYGQDPDAISHQERVLIFKELLRVLKPGGQFIFAHHWIPGPGFPKEDAKAIDKFNADLKFLAMDDCNADRYLADLATAGFKVDSFDDTYDLTAAHTRAVCLLHMKKHGEIKDKWMANNLSYIDRGLPFGLQAVCTKPGGKHPPKKVAKPRGDPSIVVRKIRALFACTYVYIDPHHGCPGCRDFVLLCAVGGCCQIMFLISSEQLCVICLDFVFFTFYRLLIPVLIPVVQGAQVTLEATHRHEIERDNVERSRFVCLIFFKKRGGK